MTLARTGPSRRLAWCIAAGVWSLVFAARHFYSALGGRAGLGTQSAAADAALELSWFAAYNVAAGCLGIAGSAVAYLLATSRISRHVHLWLVIATAIGGIVLLLRGMLGPALLGLGALGSTPEEQVPVILLAIEPSFVGGGLAFGAVALSQRGKYAETER